MATCNMWTVSGMRIAMGLTMTSLKSRCAESLKWTIDSRCGAISTITTWLRKCSYERLIVAAIQNSRSAFMTSRWRPCRTTVWTFRRGIWHMMAKPSISITITSRCLEDWSLKKRRNCREPIETRMCRILTYSTLITPKERIKTQLACRLISIVPCLSEPILPEPHRSKKRNPSKPWTKPSKYRWPRLAQPVSRGLSCLTRDKCHSACPSSAVSTCATILSCRLSAKHTWLNPVSWLKSAIRTSITSRSAHRHLSKP